MVLQDDQVDSMHSKREAAAILEPWQRQQRWDEQRRAERGGNQMARM